MTHQPAYVAAREAARHKSGQFGTQVRGEADVDLLDHAYADSADGIDWGTDPDVVVGQGSMWGPIDAVETPAPGIVRAHTASHGGYKLSPQRNAAIPAGLRQPSGWYEEDAEAYIVAMYHPDAVKHWGDPEDLAADYAEDKVRAYFPDGYERATGREIPFGESSHKDTATFRTMHADAWQVIGGSSNEYTDDNGTRYVRLRRVGDAAQDVWVEMATETQRELEKQRTDFGAAQAYMLPALVGPDDMIRTVPDPRPGIVNHHGIADYSGRSAAAQAKIDKDLDKLWRDDDGKVRSLREMIATEGISEKKVVVEGGRRVYYLSQQLEYGSSVWSAIKVTKDTWDVVEAPDNRTPVDEAQEAYQVASDRYQRVRDEIEKAWRPTAEQHAASRAAGEAVANARTTLETVREAWTAQMKALLSGGDA